jgi:hypothetical protein
MVTWAHSIGAQQTQIALNDDSLREDGSIGGWPAFLD